MQPRRASHAAGAPSPPGRPSDPASPGRARRGPACARARPRSPADPAPGRRGVAVRLEGVEKRYGDVVAVDGVDLDVHDGEFFSMLGPSGLGQDDDPPDDRRLRAADGRHGSCCTAQDVTHVPPFDRDVNTVFQDYALFPHMTVGDNVGVRAGGPQGRRRPSATQRVTEALRMVRLEGYEGPQARAALGRPAPARRPRPRARQPAPRAAAGRAPRRPRPEAPRGDADRAQGHPAAGRASPSSTSPTTRRRRSR